jgi:hypothetical protein
MAKGRVGLEGMEWEGKKDEGEGKEGRSGGRKWKEDREGWCPT